MIEDVSIVMLSADESDKFGHMIPDKLKASLQQKEVIIMGATGYDDICMGVVVFKEYARNMEIIWMYVEPEFRNIGIASAIVQRMFETIEKSNYFIGIVADYLKLGNTIISKFFKSNGFEVEEQEWPVYTFLLNEALTLKLYMVNQKMFEKNVFSVSECFDVTKKFFSQKLMLSNEINPIELPIDWDRYDVELSKVYIENNEIAGVVLIENHGSYIDVAFAYLKDNPCIFTYMIGNVFVDAKEKFGDSNPIVSVTSLDVAIDKLLLYLVPCAKKTSIMHAKLNVNNL